MYDFDKAVDLTHHLRNGMPVYPGDPAPSFERFKSLERDRVNLMKLTLGSHTGTHLDAPRHFIENGLGIDQIPPARLVGEAYVADFSMKEIGTSVTGDDLRRVDRGISADDMVICFTGCSEHWGDESVMHNYTYLDKSAADYLVSKKVRAVGIDFLSVEKFQAVEPVTHKTLLGHGIFIIESLSLNIKRFVGQRVLMICLPIKLKDGDGAPARVLAIPISGKEGRRKGD